MSKAVRLSDVTVRIGPTQILRELSLSVAAGEFVTLLGPSGSGKTTTLNAIAGFIGADGTIEIGDRSVEGVPPEDRNIGIVFQNYALFPHMTVLENIEFPLTVRGIGRDHRRSRVADMLDLVHLSGYESRAASTLSGGQQQRVALARALSFEPELLLLDEPLSALDKQLREAMQTELKRIQREVGVTTIAVTHDQVEAMSMSDRVAVMSNGVIEQCADPVSIYERPATEFVARFIGETNILDSATMALFQTACTQLDSATASERVVVRPEDVEISPKRTELSAPMEVTHVQYQGSRTRVMLKNTSGTELIAYVGHLPLTGVGDVAHVRIRRCYPMPDATVGDR